MNNNPFNNDGTLSFSLTSPYQLNSPGQDSDAFYILLDLFTEKVLKKGREWFGETIEQYRHSIFFLKTELKQTSEENLLDLLILGVLWNEYKGRWSNHIKLNAVFLNQLYRLRKISALKNFSDNLRGKLGHILLNNPADLNTKLTHRNLQRLTLWLSSTNEFNEEVLQIKLWTGFLGTLSEVARQAIFQKLIDFANWFKSESSIVFKKYTKNVEPFLQNHTQSYKRKEDYFFTGRSEVEYHLNMVGAAIMNRNMRHKFLETCNQILLLPACMAKNKKCQAKETLNGFTCSHCSPNCKVSIVTKEMELEGVQTFLAYHSTGFSKTLKEWANQSHTGLIGTACTLNLLTGGFEMKRLNIPAQCVFLDYCGCKKHWDPQGIPTSINIHQLKKVVNTLKNKAV